MGLASDLRVGRLCQKVGRVLGLLFLVVMMTMLYVIAWRALVVWNLCHGLPCIR
jgi:tetrahydromethanopterin S-methyltransferase subunit G